MKRLFTVFVAALVLAALLVVMAAPAFARGPCGDINNNGHECVFKQGKPETASQGSTKKQVPPRDTFDN